MNMMQQNLNNPNAINPTMTNYPNAQDSINDQPDRQMSDMNTLNIK